MRCIAARVTTNKGAEAVSRGGSGVTGMTARSTSVAHSIRFGRRSAAQISQLMGCSGRAGWQAVYQFKRGRRRTSAAVRSFGGIGRPDRLALDTGSP